MATVQSDIMVGSVKNMVDRLSRDFSAAKPPMTLSDGRKPLISKPSHPLAVVTFQYTATQNDELTLAVGDIIEVLEEVEEGWAKGRVQRTGETGVYPTNFVESKASPVTAPTKEDTIAKRASLDDKPEAIKRTPSVVLPSSTISALGIKKEEVKEEKIKEMARVKFVYEPQHPDELKLDEIGALIEIIRKDCGDAGWFEGELNGKTGLFPDNFVELVQMPATCKSGSPKSVNMTKIEKVSKPPLVPPSGASIAPPAVPAKPTKPKITENSLIMNSTPAPPASNTKPVSSNFADLRSKLAQGLKVVAPGDAVPSVLSKSTIVASSADLAGPTMRPMSTIEARSEENDESTQLNHITKDRPRPPGKRPMSVLVQKKRQSSDNVLESPSASSEGSGFVSSISNQFSTNVIDLSPSSAHGKSSIAMKPAAIKEETKREEVSSKGSSYSFKDKTFLSNSSCEVSSPYKSAAVGASGDASDFVSRKEYNELLNKVSALEMRLAALEKANR